MVAYVEEAYYDPLSCHHLSSRGQRYSGGLTVPLGGSEKSDDVLN
jgi:hypothetical protein